MLFLRRYHRRRSITHNFQHGVTFFGSVIMDLLAKVLDKAARRQRDCGIRLILGPRPHPPGSGDHRYEAVIRMEVGMAHVVRVPLHKQNVKSWLIWIPVHYSGGGPVRAFHPFDLVK